MDHAARLALYEKLIATQPEVACKGAAMRYTSLNGHMFSFLSKTGEVAIRLSETEREAFLKKYRATVTVQHNIVMKEYVEVPDAPTTRHRSAAPRRRAAQRGAAWVGGDPPAGVGGEQVAHR